MKFKLGTRVKDTATGFIGIAAHYTESLTSQPRYAVQPPVLPDNSFKDAFMFDEDMLEFVDDGVSANCPAATTDVPIKLGTKVKDIVSGFTGIATTRITYMNGCVHFMVEDQYSKKDGKLPEDHFPYQRLKEVGKGVLAELTKKIAAPKTGAKKPPGGPITSARAYSQR